MMHICVGKLPVIGSNNGLLPGQHQVIIGSNGDTLIGPLWTNFCEIFIEIQTLLLKKMCSKMWSEKCCPFHLSLQVLQQSRNEYHTADSLGTLFETLSERSWILLFDMNDHISRTTNLNQPPSDKIL